MDKESLGLYIVSTPIGNLDDISKRAIYTLQNSDLIICENPIHSLKLLNKFGIKKKLISVHDYNEEKVLKNLENELKNKKISLISDAGSPLISDPGYKIVQHCILNNIDIYAIPGPSSLLPALQLSGLSISEFSFYGFFPKTKKKAEEFITKIKNHEYSSVFFVSRYKLELCLDILYKEMPERLISVSKELTKINEIVLRGTSKQIREKITNDKVSLKGEFVFVVSRNNQTKSESINIENYEKQIIKLLSKFSLTDVVEIVHKLTGINKNKVYKWALNLKKH